MRQYEFAAEAAQAVIVVCLTAPPAFLLRDFLLSGSRRFRALAWGVLFLPLVAPAALTGYAYSSFSLSLIRHPNWNMAFYVVLQAARLVPAAALVLLLAPRGLSAQAVHCHRLLRRGLLRQASFQLRGNLRAMTAMGSVIFLLAFSEFDLASLLGISTWPVRLFDAHAGGLPLRESLRLALNPAVIMAFPLVALILTLRLRDTAEEEVEGRSGVSRLHAAAAWGVLLGASVFVVFLPLWMTLKQALPALGTSLMQRTVAREIGSSLFFGVVSGCTGYVLSGWMLRRYGGILMILALPGLLGALALSLALVRLFHMPSLRSLYDTPLPLLIGLTLLFLPFALAVRFLMRRATLDPSLHAAALMRSSPVESQRRRGNRILSYLRSRGRFPLILLLFVWGYLELNASTILAPMRMTPALARLYNLMHYGRSAGLSAMLLLTMAAPLVVAAIAAGARTFWIRWRLSV